MNFLFTGLDKLSYKDLESEDLQPSRSKHGRRMIMDKDSRRFFRRYYRRYDARIQGIKRDGSN